MIIFWANSHIQNQKNVHPFSQIISIMLVVALKLHLPIHWSKGLKKVLKQGQTTPHDKLLAHLPWVVPHSKLYYVSLIICGHEFSLDRR